MPFEVPQRDIRDPRTLRAIAHPVRLQLMEELTAGPATATELAERVGESVANCSWHLRQLARYGFIEEAGGGTGRRRPWRIVLQANRWGHPGEDAELATVGDAAAELLMANEYAAMRRWYTVRREEPPAWREASFTTQSQTWLTSDELRAVSGEIRAVLMRHLDRLDPDKRPPGTRLIRLVAWGVPRLPAESAEDTSASGGGTDA